MIGESNAVFIDKSYHLCCGLDFNWHKCMCSVLLLVHILHNKLLSVIDHRMCDSSQSYDHSGGDGQMSLACKRYFVFLEKPWLEQEKTIGTQKKFHSLSTTYHSFSSYHQ